MIPDKDQVREALDAYEQWGLVGFHDFAENHYNATVSLFAVARAFVDGSLLPAEPDYEAAAETLRPYLTEDMPGWTSGWQEAVARRVVDAALAGKQETGI